MRESITYHTFPNSVEIKYSHGVAIVDMEQVVGIICSV